MKLKKLKVETGGYLIELNVGGRLYESYWSSPAKSVDHADLEYLRNRYPYIKTNLRASRFKELYKNLWIELTEAHLTQMRHCLGLDWSKKAYRNYVMLNSNDEIWTDLVSKGLAVVSEKKPESNNYSYFRLTKQGVYYILGRFISDKVYNEL